MRITACKHLDYSDNYTAKKEIIKDGNAIKVFWNRKVINEEDPNMVQFCKLRGRLNNPFACTTEDRAKCRDYLEFEHDIDDSTITI